MPKKSLILAGAIIIILVLIGISFSYGYRLGVEKPAQIQILGLETSAVIRGQHANAEGEITEILNRTLTLFANGDKLEIPIGDGARVIVLEPEIDEEIIGPREIEFKDLKLGDKVEVLIELLPDEDFMGIHITVLPE